MPLHQVLKLDQRLLKVANDIHGVQQSAYSIEARLIGSKEFPPLKITSFDIQQSTIDYCGVVVDDLLIGAIGSESVGDGNRDITCLVILPQWHRKGVATTLLVDLLERYSAPMITVSTATKNKPAISLYAKFGFIEIDRVVKQPESIEIVNFCITRVKI